MDGKLEFPAYNIYFLRGGSWRRHFESPIMQKKLDEVKEQAKMVLHSNTEILAVKVFGIFNRHQHPLWEVSRGSVEQEII